MMGRTTFAFSNVLTVDKVDDFFERFEKIVDNVQFLDRCVERRDQHAVQYLDCYVERRDQSVVERECVDPNYPRLRNVVGMIQFGLKQELPNVKQLFLSGFGKTLCVHLFVLPVLNVNKFHGFVKEQETGVCRAWTWGKFKKPKNKIKNKSGIWTVK